MNMECVYPKKDKDDICTRCLHSTIHEYDCDCDIGCATGQKCQEIVAKEKLISNMVIWVICNNDKCTISCNHKSPHSHDTLCEARCERFPLSQCKPHIPINIIECDKDCSYSDCPHRLQHPRHSGNCNTQSDAKCIVFGDTTLNTNTTSLPAQKRLQLLYEKLYAHDVEIGEILAAIRKLESEI